MIALKIPYESPPEGGLFASFFGEPLKPYFLKINGVWCYRFEKNEFDGEVGTYWVALNALDTEQREKVGTHAARLWAKAANYDSLCIEEAERAREALGQIEAWLQFSRSKSAVNVEDK